MLEIVEVALMASILGFALLAVEARKPIKGIVLICIMNAIIGIIYWLLNSPLVAMFNMLVYVGALAALFLTTASLVGFTKVLNVRGRFRILGLVTTTMVAVTFLFLLLTEPFSMQPTTNPGELVPPNISKIMSAVSEILWSQRGPDMIAKAIVLVTAITCCILILGKKEE